MAPGVKPSKKTTSVLSSIGLGGCVCFSIFTTGVRSYGYEAVMSVWRTAFQMKCGWEHMFMIRYIYRHLWLTFPRTVSCCTSRWAFSVFPAPLSPLITIHWTQTGTENTVKLVIIMLTKWLYKDVLFEQSASDDWAITTSPGLCCMTPWTGRRRQPQQRCVAGSLYASLLCTS